MCTSNSVSVNHAHLLQDCSELIQHEVMLIADTKRPDQNLALGKIVVSVVFRPVASVGRASPQCHVTGEGGAGIPLSGRAGGGRSGSGSGLKLKTNRNSGSVRGGTYGIP